MSPRPGPIVAAALLPPLGTYLARGAGTEFLVTCGLTLLGFVPGMIYALWIVLRGERERVPAAA